MSQKPFSPAAAPPSPSEAVAADAPERPSKSQRKREMTALQKLGQSLLALSAEQLASIELPEPLREAIAEMRHVSSHEGRRRQLQYIGKLMRQVDPEPLRTALENVTGESKQAVALMHRCEVLRDRLLADDGALTDVLSDFPQADVQHLRATIRAARREHEEGKPAKHARLLYRWLHQQLLQKLETA